MSATSAAVIAVADNVPCIPSKQDQPWRPSFTYLAAYLLGMWVSVHLQAAAAAQTRCGGPLMRKQEGLLWGGQRQHTHGHTQYETSLTNEATYYASLKSSPRARTAAEFDRHRGCCCSGNSQTATAQLTPPLLLLPPLLPSFTFQQLLECCSLKYALYVAQARPVCWGKQKQRKDTG